MNAPATILPTSPEALFARATADILDGRGEAAVAVLQRLLEQAAPTPALYYWLSAAHAAAGQEAAQAESLQTAQILQALDVLKQAGVDLPRLQTDPQYMVDTAVKLYQADVVSPVSICLSRLMSDPMASAAVILLFSLSLQHQGRMEEAIAALTAGAVRHPSLRQNLLYACFFREDGVLHHAEEVRHWAQTHLPEVDRPALRFANPSADGRPLRVGYVAPTFAQSQLRQFFTPVLDAHDPAAVEVFLYPMEAASEPAGASARIHPIGALSDADAAALIRADRIDVLVDLWGHTVGSRLGVFALKPAPVQVSWMNYVQSTGLEAMDYVIHADCMDAPGTQALFTETIWRLPVMAPFRPDERPPASPAPALRNGYVTFGCFNHPAKLSRATVAAWSRVLKGRPGSRLVLKYRYFVDPVLQNATCARFAAHGVDPSRIDFRGQSPAEEYLKAYGDIDLALDPSPCPGGTTTCDAVANGTPVLTLRGDDFYARIGLVATEVIGLPELVAESWDDYVAKALALTEAPEALDALRTRVRQQFDASLLRDETGCTRMIEAAFREMFALWRQAA